MYEMSLDKRINAFIVLGTFLKQFKNKEENVSIETLNNKYYEDFEFLIKRQKAFNGWFTESFVLDSIEAIGLMLTQENLHNWVSNYKINKDVPNNVCVVIA